MIHQIVLETAQLVLKSITPAFIHGLFNESNQQEIMLYFNCDASGYYHLKNMHENGMETHRISLFYFLLFDKETNICIGECGFHTWNKTHARAELFYSLKEDIYKRKGLMTQALSEIIGFGFKQLKIHRIEALTADWNAASIKLLENFSFTKEGIMREDYLVGENYENSACYALLKHEWNG